MPPTDQLPQSRDDPLPPGQHAVAELRVINLGIQPAFDPDTWRLEVAGLVETPLQLSWQDFLDLPQVERVSAFHCVEGWSVLKCRWEGVLFGTLMEAAAVKPDARFVCVESRDDYSTNMPLEVAMDDDVLLARRLNGEPLPQAYGGPLRLIVPKRYAYKSAKWVRRIELLRDDRLGYWELRGYSNTADPWTNDRGAARD
ncbi:MAG: molybdopterin-dependent oxidoreductase [Candidatus Brocadiaceae bacterium]